MKKIVLLSFGILTILKIYSQEWELVQSNTNRNLYSVHFPTSSVGYIAGAYGTVLKTTDAGSTWGKLNSGEDKTLESIFFFNEQEGIVVGYRKIIKTKDGGNTWTEILDIGFHFYSLCFLDDNNGFVVGSTSSIPCIMKTSDGGETWVKKTVHSENEYILRSVCFSNSNIGYSVGYFHINGVDKGCVLKTTDGGENWYEQSFGNIEAGFGSVLFINSLVGYIAGGNYFVNGEEHYIIFKTTNGGTTWDTTFYKENQRVQGMFFTDLNTGYIAGDWGGIVGTSNGGDDWTGIDIQGFSWSNSLWFTDSETGIVVGYGGDIAKATPFVPEIIISLSGNLSFGDVTVGEYSNKTLTISNSGNSELSVTSIELPTDFTADWTTGTISANTSKNVQITFTPSASQSYSGEVTINGNFTSGSNKISINGVGIESVGIEENYQIEISCFPNPAKEFIKIKSELGIESISIIDMMGKNIYYETQINNAKKEIVIDMNEFKKGTYIVQINGIGFKKSVKIILE